MPRKKKSETQLAEQRKRVHNALANPVFFGEVYVRPYDPNWRTDLPKFGREMLLFAVKARRGVFVLPPEFLKTTLLSQVYPLWLTYRSAVFGNLLRGMLLSEEEGMATNNLSVISWHILNNEYLLNDFSDNEGRPLVYPDPEEETWRDDAIVVSRRGAFKDPTWQAKGLDSKGIQGRRLDYLVGDDVITPRNAWSPTLRKRALDTWDLQIETRLVETGQALICGNFNDARDLLSILSARDGYTLFRRPSIHRPDQPDVPPSDTDIEDPDKAVPTWPSNWSRNRLLAERRSKPQRFRRIHLLDSRAERGERLLIDWMTVIDPDETPLKYSRFYIGMDPAPGGQGEDLDFFNITVGAMHGNNLDIVQSFNVRCPTPRQVEIVRLMHDTYQRLGEGVVAIGASRVALDRYMSGAVTIHSPELGHKLVDIGVGVVNKEERLEGLGPYAQTGWLRVWETAWMNKTSDIHDQYQELTLLEEWRDFPYGTHDDRLDGLDICIRTAREFAGVGAVDFTMEALESF